MTALVASGKRSYRRQSLARFPSARCQPGAQQAGQLVLLLLADDGGVAWLPAGAVQASARACISLSGWRSTSRPRTLARRTLHLLYTGPGCRDMVAIPSPSCRCPCRRRHSIASEAS
jgi:hypothetical protein